MKISGYSTALFSTWFFLEDHGILFDAGDGVCSALTQKAGAIKHVFITHADRDHFTGLSQLLQLNARKVFPKVYFPSGCGSFPALKNFLSQFDPHVGTVEWIPVDDGDELRIDPHHCIKAVRNEHVRSDFEVTKSLSYTLERRKRKLKSEHRGLSGKEIGELRRKFGEAYISDEVAEPIIEYSGDTPVRDPGSWGTSRGLIHESTFLRQSDVHPRGNRHSSLEELLVSLDGIDLEFLILSHFSSRYSRSEILDELSTQLQGKNIEFPIYAVFPGESYLDILSTQRMDLTRRCTER